MLLKVTTLPLGYLWTFRKHHMLRKTNPQTNYMLKNLKQFNAMKKGKMLLEMMSFLLTPVLKNVIRNDVVSSDTTGLHLKGAGGSICSPPLPLPPDPSAKFSK